jgi:hypothetical protein
VTFLLRLLEEGGGGGGGGGSSSVGGGAASSSGDAGGNGGDTGAINPSGVTLIPLPRLTDDLRRLRVKLSPLRSIEHSLVRVISRDSPQQVGAGTVALPSERAFEVSVRSDSRWKSIFRRNASADPASSKASSQWYEELQNARRVIEACREDIIALWNHPAIQAGLAEQSVSLEFQSGLCVTLLSLPAPLLP